MKNASKAVRQAYYDALHGNITYNGITVPMYRDEPVETTPDYFIKIISVDETNDPTDSKFVKPVVITLDIVVRQYRYRNTDAVDDISESVTELILATVGGQLQTQYFQIGHIQLEGSRYLEGKDGEYYITRKILQFNQTLIEY